MSKRIKKLCEPITITIESGPAKRSAEFKLLEIDDGLNLLDIVVLGRGLKWLKSEFNCTIIMDIQQKASNISYQDYSMTIFVTSSHLKIKMSMCYGLPPQHMKLIFWYTGMTVACQIIIEKLKTKPKYIL
ncbi:hypothetical protein JTB14_001291 [Gonioctena quinquepunctata]|nr:hypothetical protein JTB14_001291 [Gonioctena quinquepunctata]